MLTNKSKLQNLINVLGEIEISDSEMKTLEWLSTWEKTTVLNLINLIEKTKKRGAGRKKTVDVQLIQKLRSEGKTQEQVARELNISISTVRRNDYK